MHEIVKCHNCGKEIEFIKAVQNGWQITPLANSDIVYVCNQCKQILKDKIDKWINSKENKEGIKKMKEKDNEWNDKCQY